MSGDGVSPMRTSLAVAFLVLLASGARPAAAQDDVGACKALDFLIGNWSVTSSDGKPMGEIVWAPSADHCVLEESWRRAGEAGELLGVMAYSRAARNWFYLVVSPKGVRERFDNGLGREREVEFSRSEPASPMQVRLSFAQMPDGRLRELARLSSDGGRTWSVRYDLTWAQLP